jgi:hypothetical protein
MSMQGYIQHIFNQSTPLNLEVLSDYNDEISTSYVHGISMLGYTQRILNWSTTLNLGVLGSYIHELSTRNVHRISTRDNYIGLSVRDIYTEISTQGYTQHIFDRSSPLNLEDLGDYNGRKSTIDIHAISMQGSIQHIYDRRTPPNLKVLDDYDGDISTR